jgi:hypothetical protein
MACCGGLATARVVHNIRRLTQTPLQFFTAADDLGQFQRRLTINLAETSDTKEKARGRANRTSAMSIGGKPAVEADQVFNSSSLASCVPAFLRDQAEVIACVPNTRIHQVSHEHPIRSTVTTIKAAVTDTEGAHPDLPT